MSVKSWLGMDAVDLAIHIGVTVCMMGFVGVNNGPEGLFPVIMMGSMLLLAVRRKMALRRGIDRGSETDRLAEVEERLHYVAKDIVAVMGAIVARLLAEPGVRGNPYVAGDAGAGVAADESVEPLGKLTFRSI